MSCTVSTVHGTVQDYHLPSPRSVSPSLGKETWNVYILNQHMSFLQIFADVHKHLSLKLVQSLSWVRRFTTPWTAACQASLSFTIFWSLLKLMSIESVMPSNHLILCCPFLLLPSVFPSIKDFFPVSWLLTSDGHSIGASASASVLPMNIQGWFPLGLTSLISLQSKGLSRVFSNTTWYRKHQYGWFSVITYVLMFNAFSSEK